jgi:hypothetical protein
VAPKPLLAKVRWAGRQSGEDRGGKTGGGPLAQRAADGSRGQEKGRRKLGQTCSQALPTTAGRCPGGLFWHYLAVKTTLCSTRQLDRPQGMLIVNLFSIDRYGNQLASETESRSLPYSSVEEAFFAVTLCPISRYILAQYFAVSGHFWPFCARFCHHRDTSVPIHAGGASAPSPTWPRPGGRFWARLCMPGVDEAGPPPVNAWRPSPGTLEAPASARRRRHHAHGASRFFLLSYLA